MRLPIYAIIAKGEVEVSALVRAPNRARAIAHFTRNNYITRVADPEDLIAATKEGVEVEDASEAEAAEPETRG